MLQCAWLFLSLLACQDCVQSYGNLLVEVRYEGDGWTDPDSVEVTAAGGGEAETLTGSADQGYYQFRGSPGSYTVTVVACGGAQTLQEDVSVEAQNLCQDVDETAWVDIELQPCL